MMSRSTHPSLSILERKALDFIRRSIVGSGRAPSVRDLMSALGYKSPRSSAVVIDRLISLGYLDRGPAKSLRLLLQPQPGVDEAKTVDVPIVGCAPCGLPLLAQENVEATVPVSDRLARPGHSYFILRAVGDSMTEAGIEDDALVLVRQQSIAEHGQVVVALIDEEATIKELRRSHDAVALVPRSQNTTHRPIILNRDFRVQGVVVATLPSIGPHLTRGRV